MLVDIIEMVVFIGYIINYTLTVYELVGSVLIVDLLQVYVLVLIELVFSFHINKRLLFCCDRFYAFKNLL